MYICTKVCNNNAVLLGGDPPPSQNHTIYKGNAKQEIHVNLKILDYPDNEDLVSSLSRCFCNWLKRIQHKWWARGFPSPSHDIDFF